MIDTVPDIIQTAVRMERARCLSIILKEAAWLNRVASGQPDPERSKILRESSTLIDLAGEIGKGES